jgi:hypothetical protein
VFHGGTLVVERAGGFAQTAANTGLRANRGNGGGDELQKSIKSAPIGGDYSWLYRDRFDQIIVSFSFLLLVPQVLVPQEVAPAIDMDIYIGVDS